MEFCTGGYGFAEFNAAGWKVKMRRVAVVLARAYKRGDFQAVAVTGSSGVSAAFAVRALLPDDVDIPFIVVRKDGEGSHAGKITVASGRGTDFMEITKVAILDDLVASGTTLQRIMQGLNSDAGNEERVRCVTVYTYTVHSFPRDMTPDGSDDVFHIVSVQ